VIQGILKRLLVAVVLGVLVFAGFGLYADLSELSRNLMRFEWAYLPLALLLAVANYALRFWRWHTYLRVVDVELPAASSAGIFLSGFVMSVTPAKFGELLKAFLVRDAFGAPVARTAPVIVAERLTDFISLCLLCSVGIVTFDYGGVVVLVCAVLSLVAVVLISSRPLAHKTIELTRKVPGLRRLSDKLHEMYESMAELVRPGPLLWATVLGLVAWVSECFSFYFVCLGLGVEASSVTVSMAIFIYAFSTIFGAVTMLPGGLGATEGSMTGLLVLLGKMAQAPAVAVTLLVRVCTLWFGVGVGVVALLWWRRAERAAGRTAAEVP
jgi:uncharacterized protein (TIRG00374 family)